MKKIILFFIVAIVLFSCQQKDKQAPIIILNGSNPMYVILNKNFKDPGAIADDNKDKDITNKIIMTHNVPINGPANGEGTTKDTGTYYVTYTCKDAAGNTATKKRTVIVKNQIQQFTSRYELTVNAFAGNIFKDTTISGLNLNVDNRVNLKIWLPKMAGQTGYRCYGLFNYDTTDNLYHVMVPKQYIRKDENNVKMLYVFTNENLSSYIQESKVIDTIDPTFSVKYHVYKCRYNNNYGTISWNDTLWEIIKDDYITDFYTRF